MGNQLIILGDVGKYNRRVLQRQPHSGVSIPIHYDFVPTDYKECTSCQEVSFVRNYSFIRNIGELVNRFESDLMIFAEENKAISIFVVNKKVLYDPYISAVNLRLRLLFPSSQEK